MNTTTSKDGVPIYFKDCNQGKNFDVMRTGERSQVH